MCTDCGCSVKGDTVRIDGERAAETVRVEAVSVLENLLADNDRQATHNRTHFDRRPPTTGLTSTATVCWRSI
jgi:hydrogenase nickel incorporation protein HypB